MRLFVAVWPSEEAAAALAALPRPAVAGLRWTTPDQWHVTVAFLGDIAEETAGSVAGALKAAAMAASPAAAVRLGPRTVRLGRSILCVPADGLGRLADAVRAALASAGLDPPPSDGAFQGHCTLARARRGRAVPAQLVGVPVTARWTATALCLVRSTLDPGGARYETLASATVPS